MNAVFRIDCGDLEKSAPVAAPVPRVLGVPGCGGMGIVQQQHTPGPSSKAGFDLLPSSARMARCVYCGARKGKRACPALGGAICPSCCGSHRQVDIACPEACPFLPRATLEAYRSTARQLMDFAGARPEWEAQATREWLGSDPRTESWEESLLSGWTCYGRESKGVRLIDEFARETGESLRADEKAALDRLRNAWCSLLEVEEVRPGQGLGVRDLVGQRSVFLCEPQGTYYVDRGDLMLGWVVQLAEGRKLTGAMMAVPSGMRDGVLRILTEERERVKASRPELSEDAVTSAALPGALQRIRREQRARTLSDPVSPPLAGLRLFDEAPEAAGGAESAARSAPASEQDGAPELARQSAPRGELASGQAHALPPLAHEVMFREVPPLAELLPRIVREMRARPDWGPTRTLTPRELSEVPGVQPFLQEYALFLRDHYRWSRHVCADEANFLGHHVHYIAHYEAHYRKTFWVDESLAWMLRQTRLDIVGQFLRPPFASCAFAFTDRGTLELAERFLGRERDCSIRGKTLRILTAYVTQVAAPGGAAGHDICFLFDAGAPGWPYLVNRTLLVRPDADLDAILDSHFPDVAVEALDPLFSREELKQLVHLVVNCLLYATTAHLDATILAAPPDRGSSAPGRGFSPRPGKEYSAEDVFYLPGRIPISSVRRLREMDARAEGRPIFARFMVRGHWRRPAPNWKDQGLRWIEPYWKGPDLAMILEREYQMKP